MLKNFPRASGASATKAACPAVLAITLFTGSAPAQPLERTWHLSVYGSRWVNADLLDIPERAITGRLTGENAFFAGAGLARVLVPSYSIPLPGTGLSLDDNRIELEGQVLRHFGEQAHWEGTLALVFRTGQVPLFGGLSVNFAFSEGLSYASTPPNLEGSFRVEPSRLLNYLAFEAEFSHASLPGVYLVPRIHHRSGVFGLIAPKESGSNFIGMGLRIDLK